MKKALLKSLCLLILLAAAICATSAQVVKHTLQKGETLYSVSRLYKVPYEALAAANGITDPTKVKMGTILIIPTAHTVAKGETLYGIAKQYGIALSQLLSSNKLSPTYVLKVGDVLVIPADGPNEAGAAYTSSTTPAASASTTSTTSAAAATTSIPKGNGMSSSVLPKTSTTNVSTTNDSVPPTTVQVPVSMSNGPSPSTIVQGPQNPGQFKQGGSAVPLPEPVKTQDRTVDASLKWPASGKALYLDGKLEGIMIRVKPGETAKAIASGTVVSAGPSRGFSQVVFVQAKSGYVYVYGGIDNLGVKTGDHLVSGAEIGRIGVDAKDGAPIAYFFVFRNGQPIDPAMAPRD
ncbi:MAG: LysM peptidoglycan-binding domain-containing protein [Spirochaetes bacterium]|nr:LysM peptidoglycan-binding domain-containing protein [Spirochaetota bacterium]